MGRRYKAICDWLKIEHVGIDREDDLNKVSFLHIPTHYIIATPTDKHCDTLSELNEILKGKPKVSILCEKPVAKTDDMTKGMKPLKEIHDAGHKVFMVNNYCFYPGLIPKNRGITEYTYYNSGNDGLVWDCIQLIHLAAGQIKLNNKCPYWRTIINGIPLIQDYIPGTYVDMVRCFIGNNNEYLWDFDEIVLATRKVIVYEKRNARNPG